MAEEEKKKSSRWGRGAIVVGIALLILMLWCRFCECDRCAGDGTLPVATIPDESGGPLAGDVSEAEPPPVAAGPVSDGSAGAPATSGDAALAEAAPVPEPAVVEPALATPPAVASAPAASQARKVRKPIASGKPTEVPVAAGAGGSGAAGGAGAPGAVGSATAGGAGAPGASAASAAADAGARSVAAAPPDVGSGPAAFAAGPPVGTARQRFSNPADVGFSPMGLAARPGLESANSSLRLLNPCDTAASGCQRSFAAPAAPNNAPVPGPPLPF